ncbi:MAG: hypothetical protein RJQ09_08550 [Cyclobacteriaceae bacterium]
MNSKKLDQVFKTNVKHVQKHNGIHVFWDKEGVWKKIQKALEESGAGPKMIAWTTAMAASVSLLVATTVSLKHFSFDPFQEDRIVAEEPSTEFEVNDSKKDLKVAFTSFPVDSMVIPIRSRSVDLTSPEYKATKLSVLKRSTEPIKLKKAELIYKQLKDQKRNYKPKFAVNFNGGLSVNGRYAGSQLGLGVTIDLAKKENIQKRIYLGSNVQFMQVLKQTENTAASDIATAFALRAAYEQDRAGGKQFSGWSTGAEYIMHTNDNSLQKPALKVFYTRSILGKLKIGPEILFTRNFKKAYPGITLALG